MIIEDSIFKSYDIRGLIGSELSEELAYRLGRAFAVFLKNRGFALKGDKFVVGRDMRATSLGFQTKVMQGIADEGGDVVDIGLVSTPLFNFACAHYEDHIGGIMVTASHNPAEYNGFKITFGDGLPLGKQTGMDELRELTKLDDFSTVDKVRGRGTISRREVLADYLSRIFSLVPKDEIKPIKIVVDGGNGMAGAVLPQVLQNLPQVQVEYLYIEPDGNFPNHEANPLKVETLKDLQAKVLETKADLGFALDGDADRIGLVDEQGVVVEASYVGALLGLEVLKNHHSGKMFYDLRSSMTVPEVWKDNGGEPEMSMVGHANIKKVMKETKAIFGSELSQHFYFGDMYDLESTDLCLLYVLRLLSRTGQPLSQLVTPLKKYHHSGEINFEVENKDEVITRIEDQYKGEATKVEHLDGLWMSFDWGWFNIRKSNTEPLLRLNLETKDENDLKNKLTEISVMVGK